MESSVRKVANVLATVIFVLLSFQLFAEDSVSVVPTLTKNASDKKLAKEIDDNLSLLLSSIKNADVKVVKSAKTERCKDDLKCIAQAVVKSESSDFVVVSKLTKTSSNVKIVISMFDANGKKKGSKTVTSSESDSEDIASDMFNELQKLIASAAPEEDEKPKKSSSAANRTASYSEVKEEIKKGFAAYDKGDLDEAAEIFDRAANELNCKCQQNEIAKQLLDNVKKIQKGLPKATDTLDDGDYKSAMRVLETLRKTDSELREQGYKAMVFKKDKNNRKRYAEPNPQDAQTVEQIHKNFKSKIEEVRKWREKQLSDIDDWVNNNIKAREKAINDLKNKEKELTKQQKDAETALKNKIRDMKYQWEKDDTSLEQEIVNLESQITQIEQREKGVIKVSNKKRDEAKENEFKAHDKAYSDWKKKHQQEKDAYYEKQKKLETTEGEKVTKKVAELEKKKQALEAKNRDIDAKIQKMADEFEANERKIMADNEAVRMRNEDEDRKYNVQVEKEYQKKFDSLNQNLAKYDDQESAKERELQKYQQEIEEFMMKSATTLGTIQENTEKERAKAEADYAKEKEAAQTKLEKDYEDTLNKLAAQKTKLEEDIAKHTDDTETMKAKKEEAMVAENEKTIVAAEQKIAANEDAIAKTDQEYEEKIAKIQDIIAKTVDDEENEKANRVRIFPLRRIGIRRCSILAYAESARTFRQTCPPCAARPLQDKPFIEELRVRITIAMPCPNAFGDALLDETVLGVAKRICTERIDILDRIVSHELVEVCGILFANRIARRPPSQLRTIERKQGHGKRQIGASHYCFHDSLFFHFQSPPNIPFDTLRKDTQDGINRLRDLAKLRSHI